MKRLLPNSLKIWLKELFKNPFMKALLSVFFELRMLLTTLMGKLAFARLSTRSNIKLHLGCGYDVREGWVNIDMVKSSGAKLGGNRVFIAYDLRRNIPLKDQSCVYIYSSHFWEHLDYMTGFKMMQESHRVLAEGGTFRIVLPDFEHVFKAYVNQDSAFFDGIATKALINVAGAETILDYVHYSVYQYGEHVCLYDTERVCKMLTQAGFKNVRPVTFDPNVDIDLPLRRRYSLYVEATR